MVELSSIVLCLILDSRQNHDLSELFLTELYCALFWIQGKTSALLKAQQAELYCALFWIQGKTRAFFIIKPRRLYCALFWIQGKTGLQYKRPPVNCTVPYFGFKAKPRTH